MGDRLLHHGDCLHIMKDIPDNSIDMILCDLPYGTTACKWDVIIPFEPMWKEIKRVRKERAAVALFGSEPFSSYLRMSNIGEYKYDWVWDKKLAGNGILSKVQPLKIHELISIFNSKVYYPEKVKGVFRKKMTGDIKVSEINGGDGIKEYKEYQNDEYYPKTIQEFSIGGLRINRLHPTQKPVSLLEYLIKTYTIENETVLDFTMGSGSTGIACIETNRNFIGIEKDDKYFDIAVDRIREEESQGRLCYG